MPLILSYMSLVVEISITYHPTSLQKHWCLWLSRSVGNDAMKGVCIQSGQYYCQHVRSVNSFLWRHDTEMFSALMAIIPLTE